MCSSTGGRSPGPGGTAGTRSARARKRGARTACLLAGCVLTACLPALRAAAQHPGFGPPQPRPLHARLEAADAVAIASVDRVEPGRIHVAHATGVRGRVEAAFALKRSPTRTPPLEPGDRALLLLRGARPPYVLVDAPHEQIVLGEDDDAEAWSRAVRELAGAASPAEVYARWLERETPGLQRAAALGLVAALRPALGPAREPAPELLLRALRHPDAHVRATAVRASMPWSRDRDVRAALVRIASEDPDEALRALARRIMKGPQRAVPDGPASGPHGPRIR